MLMRWLIHWMTWDLRRVAAAAAREAEVAYLLAQDRRASAFAKALTARIEKGKVSGSL